MSGTQSGTGAKEWPVEFLRFGDRGGMVGTMLGARGGVVRLTLNSYKSFCYKRGTCVYGFTGANPAFDTNATCGAMALMTLALFHTTSKGLFCFSEVLRWLVYYVVCNYTCAC